jgi:hypothetical protein
VIAAPLKQTAASFAARIPPAPLPAPLLAICTAVAA